MKEGWAPAFAIDNQLTTLLNAIGYRVAEQACIDIVAAVWGKLHPQ